MSSYVEFSHPAARIWTQFTSGEQSYRPAMSASHSAYQQSSLFCEALSVRPTDSNVHATNQSPFQDTSSPVRAATPGVNPAALKRKFTLLQLIDELTELRDNKMDSHGIPQGSYINHLGSLPTYIRL